ncbi:hypothetical protein OOU_Y34scaffold00172g4 [Pyricularia oryzae Y34]|uniref:Uncharacterized protein n=2 Tax=Pyricularia oryzae TaxID=318829 RepID=A0AA97P754_PYRO3|nr:hypothetical protein OOU_Y34scaffold00172g4 [Pyricularia oryzae Y34]
MQMTVNGYTGTTALHLQAVA